MFSWKQQINLAPYFRAVYVLQMGAVAATLAGLFLIWWEGADRLTALDILAKTTEDIARRNPQLLGQPLMVLWLVWAGIVVSSLRSFTGVLVTPVSYWWLAMVTWLVSMAAIAHFYISFGGDAAGQSPLGEGQIQAGFWLTASSMALLGLLIMLEGIIKPHDVAPGGSDPARPVSDAESLWRGDYLTCPHCGMLNSPGAKTCFQCRNLLFDFRDEAGRKS